jgi:hypothetical protein
MTMLSAAVSEFTVMSPNEGYNHSKTHPARNAQAMGCTIIGNVTDDDGCDNHENAAADAALPTLCRTDAGKQLVFAEKRTAAVGTRIVGPKEDEDAQRQEHVVMYLTVECRSLERQNVNHREWQGNIHL